ncbi:MAG: hypothetical protein ACK462_12685, partial [Planctomyces sp.]
SLFVRDVASVIGEHSVDCRRVAHDVACVRPNPELQPVRASNGEQLGEALGPRGTAARAPCARIGVEEFIAQRAGPHDARVNAPRLASETVQVAAKIIEKAGLQGVAAGEDDRGVCGGRGGRERTSEARAGGTRGLDEQN